MYQNAHQREWQHYRLERRYNSPEAFRPYHWVKGMEGGWRSDGEERGEGREGGKEGGGRKGGGGRRGGRVVGAEGEEGGSTVERREGGVKTGMVRRYTMSCIL